MDGRRIDSKRNFCPRNLLDRVVDNYVASLDMAQRCLKLQVFLDSLD